MLITIQKKRKIRRATRMLEEKLKANIFQMIKIKKKPIKYFKEKIVRYVYAIFFLNIKIHPIITSGLSKAVPYCCINSIIQ
jgi:hypothetical protein